MASYTQWLRLEPRTRDEPSAGGIERGLQARIGDPLWLLARQWQFGEFQGEDAGTPVIARTRLQQAPLTQFRPGSRCQNKPEVPYDPQRTPLETVVEQEAQRPATVRAAASAGQHFLRLLKQQGAGQYQRAFVNAYPLDPARTNTLADPDGNAYAGVLCNRVPDGSALYEAFCNSLRPGDGAPPGLPPTPAIKTADKGNVVFAGLAYVQWFEDLYRQPQSMQATAWQSERLEYAFAVTAQGENEQIVLEAEEHAQGRLDWPAFDHFSAHSSGKETAETSSRHLTRTVIPGPVAFRGMPANRWWELEDADINFGAMESEATDLVRMLLIEFALTYSNDWFVLPVDLPLGALYRTRSLVVTDTFGQRLLIHPYSQVDGAGSPWRVFELSMHSASESTTRSTDAPWLFLPPVLPDDRESNPIEEVLLLRDEIANVAWAIEKSVTVESGFVIDRDEAFHARRRERQTAPEPDNTDSTGDAAPPLLQTPVVYQLSSTVPDHWTPLIPVADNATGKIRLQKGRVLNRSLQAPGALGDILESGTPLRLFEEEVTRAGARVTRNWQFSRWSDGSSHAWIGRRKRPGRGEGLSGLRYDQAVETGIDPRLTVDADDLQPEGGFDLTRFDEGAGFADND